MIGALKLSKNDSVIYHLRCNEKKFPKTIPKRNACKTLLFMLAKIFHRCCGFPNQRIKILPTIFCLLFDIENTTKGET